MGWSGVAAGACLRGARVTHARRRATNPEGAARRVCVRVFEQCLRLTL